MKIIATEEALDNWHAQSLGISTDKLLKSKKLLKNFMSSSKQQKSKSNIQGGADLMSIINQVA